MSQKKNVKKILFLYFRRLVLVSFLAIVVLGNFSLLAVSIAVINNKTISTKEFQNYINTKKFMANLKTFDDLVELENKSKAEILNDFVDEKILLLEASQNGINAKNKGVQKELTKLKEKYLHELYSSLQKKDSENTMDEKFVKDFYASLPASKQKPYSDLLFQEKQQLVQLARLKKKKDSDEIVKKRLEKKYKVKRFGIDKNIVASVGNFKITKKMLEDSFSQDLRQANINPDLLRNKDIARYNEAKEERLEQTIFEKLTEMDIKKTGFKNKKNTKKALEFLANRIILNEFFKNVVAKDIRISDQEMDQAFRSLSRVNPQIQQMIPSEQEKILRELIIQQKIPQIINNYLVEKKEEIIIKKNRKELKKIS